METLHDKQTRSGILSNLMLLATEHSLSGVVSEVMRSASEADDWSLDIFIPRAIHPPG